MKGSRLLVLSGVASFLCTAGLAVGGPGTGIKAGQVIIHPHANLSATHDSNVYRTSNDRESDAYFDGMAGLLLRYSALRFSLDAKGYAGTRNYLDETGLDFTYWGESVNLLWGAREQALLTLSQSYRKTEDIDLYGSEYAVGGVSADSILDVSSRREREISQIGLSLGRRMSDKVEMDLGVRYDAVDYEGEGLQDLNGVAGSWETAFRMTPKTAAFLTAQYGVQNGKGDNESATTYAGRLGLKTLGTDKVVFRAGIGMQSFDPDEGEDQTAVSYDGSATWAATEKILFQAGGRNGLTKSVLAANQGVEYSSFRLGMLGRISNVLNFSVAGAWRLDDYLDTDREDTGLGVRTRLDYLAPSGALRVYYEMAYENVDSNMDDRDYRGLRSTVGLNLRY